MLQGSAPGPTQVVGDACATTKHTQFKCRETMTWDLGQPQRIEGFFKMSSALGLKLKTSKAGSCLTMTPRISLVISMVSFLRARWSSRALTLKGDRPKFGEPTVATLTVGGDDIDFPGILFNCRYHQ